MSFLLDYFYSIVNDKAETPESVSSYIGANFADLYTETVAAGLDPMALLIGKMQFEELQARCATIKQFIPDFDLADYLDPEDPDAKYYCRDLVRDGVSPDRIAQTWPRLLTLQQKLTMGVSPNVIVETEDGLSNEDAVRLLELGADPDKVNEKAYLYVGQKIKYGVKPHFVRQAMLYEADQIRQHAKKLLDSGLAPEELIAAETESMYTKFHDRMKVFEWYLKHLDLLSKYTENKGDLFGQYMELVEEIIYADDLMPLETEDQLFIEAMKAAVDADLIAVDAAVEYLYGIHDKYVDEDDDGNPIPNPSFLLDKVYVHNALVA